MSASSPGVSIWRNEYEVNSGSMRRVLKPGDRIRVRPEGPQDLRMGDIVVFLADRRGQHHPPHVKLVVHRLLWKQAGPEGVLLWTKGDASGFVLEQPSPEAALIGKVIAVDEGDGRWRDLESASGRAGHLLAGGASSAFFCALSVARRLLVAVYERCLRFPRLKSVRRALLDASLTLEAF